MPKAIIEVLTKGDMSTNPGGIALSAHPGGGSFMVQDFYHTNSDPLTRGYCNGAYDLTLVEALEEFHRRAARAERYDAGGALLPDTVTLAAARSPTESADDYVAKALASFTPDPPATNYQQGYKQALEDVAARR